MTEDLLPARADPGTGRRLSAERQCLYPALRYHPDPAFRAAIEASMAIGAPVLTPARPDELVDGVALVRYVVDRPFPDDDEELLAGFARRAALEFLLVPTLGGGQLLPE